MVNAWRIFRSKKERKYLESYTIDVSVCNISREDILFTRGIKSCKEFFDASFKLGAIVSSLEDFGTFLRVVKCLEDRA
jgi:hypothetical protein